LRAGFRAALCREERERLRLLDFFRPDLLRPDLLELDFFDLLAAFFLALLEDFFFVVLARAALAETEPDPTPPAGRKERPGSRSDRAAIRAKRD